MVQPGESFSDLDALKQRAQVDGGDLGLSETAADGTTSEWDALLQALQEKATARINTYTQRDFAYHPDEQITLSGKGKTVLRMPHPVESVATVSQDGTTVESDKYDWEESGSLVKKGSTGVSKASVYGANALASQPRESPNWGDGLRNVEVTLTYGYEEPPADIQEAEEMLVDHTLVGLVQKRQSPIVQTDDFQVEANIPVSLNSEIKQMLTPHKTTRFGV